LTITERRPIETEFLEECQIDFVPPQNAEKFMLFSFADRCGKTAKLEECAAKVTFAEGTPEITKVYLVEEICWGHSIRIELFICTCRTDWGRRGLILLMPSISEATMPTTR